MPTKQKLPKALKDAASAYAKAVQVAKDAGNAANRQKTALRNAVKQHWAEEKLPIGSYIHVEGMEVRYEANSSSAIDPERVLELYEAGEISRESFLRMVKIGLTEAKNIIGGDQVAEFTVETVGKNVDIRLTDLPVEQIDEEFVMRNDLQRKKRLRVTPSKRKKIGGGTTSEAKKTKTRRIKTRVNRS